VPHGEECVGAVILRCSPLRRASKDVIVAILRGAQERAPQDDDIWENP
jgi:hypothetical protein